MFEVEHTVQPDSMAGPFASQRMSKGVEQQFGCAPFDKEVTWSAFCQSTLVVQG